MNKKILLIIILIILVFATVYQAVQVVQLKNKMNEPQELPGTKFLLNNTENSVENLPTQVGSC